MSVDLQWREVHTDSTLYRAFLTSGLGIGPAGFVIRNAADSYTAHSRDGIRLGTFPTLDRAQSRVHADHLIRIMDRHGFHSESTGGNCSRVVRYDHGTESASEIAEIVVLASDPVVPTFADDLCIAVTVDRIPDAPGEWSERPYWHRSPLTFAEIVAHLIRPSQYALLELRIDNPTE